MYILAHKMKWGLIIWWYQETDWLGQWTAAGLDGTDRWDAIPWSSVLYKLLGCNPERICPGKSDEIKTNKTLFLSFGWVSLHSDINLHSQVEDIPQRIYTVRDFQEDVKNFNQEFASELSDNRSGNSLSQHHWLLSTAQAREWTLWLSSKWIVRERDWLCG